MMEKFGRAKDIYKVKNYLVEPTVIVAYLMPFFLAALYFSIHLPIQYFLTHYLPAIKVAQILTLGLFFVPLFRMPLSICVALNRQIKIVLLTVPIILLSVILNYSLVRVGWGIEGVAIGTGISYFIFSSVIIWYAFKQLRATISEYLKFYLLIYAPFLYFVCLILVIENIIKFSMYGLGNDLIITSLKLAVFFLMFAPILILVKKHSAFIKLIDNLPLRHLVRSKSRKQFFQQ
jgi:Na+-driven multidrug efflux pump